MAVTDRKLRCAHCDAMDVLANWQNFRRFSTSGRTIAVLKTHYTAWLTQDPKNAQYAAMGEDLAEPPGLAPGANP
ncbi:MAG: hypothetical protein ACRC67_09515 [Inquilinus sp.]|uniref:hypothetical protein n=1 Tax=Inquilinus sp. TaxID=1932117 RepID=UPI003F404EC1